MDRALFIGRFQPFHNGHLAVVKFLLEKHDEVIIGIGSTDESYTAYNPLTCSERFEMIERVIHSEGIHDKIIVTIVPDTNNNKLWPNFVNSILPEFTVVYTNNPLVQRLFMDNGFNMETIPYGRDKISGTIIRNDILLDSIMWRAFVPNDVAKMIVELDIRSRLIDILRRD